MANRKAVLVWLCKTEKGWRRYPAVIGANGRARAGVVRIEGQEHKYPEGRFQIRFYEGCRMIYKDAGKLASGAMTSRVKAEHLLTAKNEAKAAGAKMAVEEEFERTGLRKALKACEQAALDRGAPESAEVIRRSGQDFLRISKRVYADEIIAEDMLRFQRELRKEGKADRTIHNRYAAIVAFLKHMGLDAKVIAPRRPKYEKKLPQVYSQGQMRKLFEFLSKKKREKLAITFEILLKAGLREQEAVYLYWSNINLDKGILHVRSKAEFNFKIKDAEERDIPIPDDLLERLRAYREKHPAERLVTGTKADNPNTKLLRTLKRVVNAAGLACGECEGCRRDNEPECEVWWLHKFRSTCITRLLQIPMDIRTVMKFSGHSDLESVMRYLSPAEDKVIQAQVNSAAFM
jgi:integrase